jgi:hypothetical protein
MYFVPYVKDKPLDHEYHLIVCPCKFDAAWWRTGRKVTEGTFTAFGQGSDQGRPWTLVPGPRLSSLLLGTCSKP